MLLARPACPDPWTQPLQTLQAELQQDLQSSASPYFSGLEQSWTSCTNRYMIDDIIDPRYLGSMMSSTHKLAGNKATIPTQGQCAVLHTCSGRHYFMDYDGASLPMTIYLNENNVFIFNGSEYIPIKCTRGIAWWTVWRTLQ